jgi:hypothetical protein
MYQIEKNVPFPAPAEHKKPEGPLRLALKAMEVGDSFVAAPGKENIVSSTACYLVKCSGFEGRKYITRKVDSGVRVWRVA